MRSYRKKIAQGLIVILVIGWISSGLWQPHVSPFRTQTVWASTAGPNATGTGAGAAASPCTDNSNWAGTGTPPGASADDTTYTSISGNSLDDGNITDELRLSNFGFSFTSSAIVGITVEVLGFVETSGDTAAYHTVSLFTAPGSNRGDNKATGSLPTSDPGITYQSFGGTSDDWYPAGTWTEAEIESNNFGVALCFTAGGADVTVNIDHVKVTVTYTAAAAAYTQNDFEWYTDEATVTLTDPWPSGSINLAENTILTQLPATNRPLVSGDKIRIQMSITVTNTLAAGGQAFQLEYDTAEDCTTASGWAVVGAIGSGTIWRFYDNVSLNDGDTQVNQILTAGVAADYVESNDTQTNPNEVTDGQDMEWDFAVENNGAAENTTFCFRLAKADGTALNIYNSDSYPKLTTAPGMSSLMRHGNIFQNAVERGFFWAN